MSHKMYDEKWQSSMEELADLVYIENPDDGLNEMGESIAAAPEVSITKQQAFRHFAMLYIRYASLFRELQDIVDQIVHPQKRRDVRIALDACMARLRHVKKSMSDFSPDPSSEYVNLNEFLEELKLSPHDIELSVPRFFEDTDNDQMREIRVCIDTYMEQYELQDVEHETTKPLDIQMPDMTLKEAVCIIMRNERGRQGCMRGKYMKKIRDEDNKRRTMQTSVGDRDPVSAVLVLQRWFRGILGRIKADQQKEEEMVFLGMIRRDETVKNHATTAEGIRQVRKRVQRDFEQDYIIGLEEAKKNVKETRGIEFKEHMWMERYNWWIEQKEKTGIEAETFDDFYLMKNPPAIEPTQNDEGTDDKETKSKGKKGKGKEEKNKNAKGKGKKTKGESGAEADENLSSTVLLAPPELLADMRKSVTQYNKVWSNLDESDNFIQKHDIEMAKDLVTPEIAEKIRLEVDEQLLIVLGNLKLQMQQRKADEAGKKGKKGKGSKGKAGGKSKKGKKGGKGKGTKGAKGKPKKMSDGEKACVGLTIDNMIDEMVKLGILRRLPASTRKISDFVGEFNYLGCVYEKANIRQNPSMMQIRQCLVEHAILSLGSEYVHQNSPIVKSLLLFGPSGSGKTMLAKAVAKQTNALWFDLSPVNIQGKLGSGKNDVPRLLHMVFTVAKQGAPAIIYIDEVEKLFSGGKKKAAPGDDMARIKKSLMAQRDDIGQNDRVMFICNSSCPYDSSVDQNEIKAFFNPRVDGKMIYLPFPDYASRVKLWRTFITQAGINMIKLNASKHFDLGTLALVSQGYTSGSIQAVVQAIFPTRRVSKLQARDYVSIEIKHFINKLAKMPYIYKDEHENFADYADTITGAKERRALQLAALTAADETTDIDAKKKSSKEGKAKKK